MAVRTHRDLVTILVVGTAVFGLCSTALTAGSNGPTIGDQAPAFELPGSDGATYRLADFRDKQVVVLAWFPKAFTGG
jgi:peroxiredoxin Q/BCP